MSRAAKTAGLRIRGASPGSGAAAGISGGGVGGKGRPYRGGMMLSVIGIGIAICGLAFRGVLRLDGVASLEVPKILQGWLATGGLRLIADAELSDPRLLFAGVGLTFLMMGTVLLVSDYMNRSEELS